MMNEKEPGTRRKRGMGALLAITGVLQIVLLANHPGGAAHDFAGVLREEAANRVMNAVVHGGFIVVLAVQLVCYAALSVRLGFTRSTMLAAFVFFAIGCAMLMGSVFVDGLIVPDISAHFAAATAEKQNAIRGVFAFAGALIQFLMPMGLAFQGCAIAAWGIALLKFARLSGFAALLLAIVIAAALAASFAMSNPMMLMAALLCTALWAMLGGAWLMRATA
jgi:hypothetical protein